MKKKGEELFALWQTHQSPAGLASPQVRAIKSTVLHRAIQENTTNLFYWQKDQLFKDLEPLPEKQAYDAQVQEIENKYKPKSEDGKEIATNVELTPEKKVKELNDLAVKNKDVLEKEAARVAALEERILMEYDVSLRFLTNAQLPKDLDGNTYRMLACLIKD